MLQRQRADTVACRAPDTASARESCFDFTFAGLVPALAEQPTRPADSTPPSLFVETRSAAANSFPAWGVRGV